MEYFLDILTLLHFSGIAGLALYGIHRIWFLICWLSIRLIRKNKLHGTKPPALDDHPKVTVQVPLYNEPLVAERVIDAVVRLDWPQEKLDIQILDDSTDVTREIVLKRVAKWADIGVPIQLIRRTGRDGYKAGALRNGMALCKGEFIALFDADFVPDPDFLEKTIPWFNKKNVGMVQARWTFINANQSWLTRLQALLLSPHFSIEHQIRSDRGLFFNFNGTAGVWRKQAIETSGGWQDDTVTEDLDLSYRAQIKGWRFLYLDHVSVLSELPTTLSHFRAQQERWTKGAVQTAIKIIPSLLCSPLSLKIKLEGMAHLMANLCWLFALVVTLTLYPVIIHRINIGIYQILWFDLPLFMFSSGAIICYYLMHSLMTGHRRFAWIIGILPLLSIGLSPCFSRCVFQGIFQKGGEFIRTPKLGLSHTRGSAQDLFHSCANDIWALLVNVPFMLYSLLPLTLTWQQGTWVALPFISLFPMGFFLVIVVDLYNLIKGYWHDLLKPCDTS
ncbi:Glycosyltransferase, catalytic subunit of cellulose synthase and poly-beta-1,6-N-acetylglucosamine synthase [Desulfobacula phenolica]|uniref:Glycosyltransferase, catalytic subunit of cellulose synthase and poly-beta-1,6-N-acetylglucosamine synthase n=2 Tax=Desulfobacula phenolica TaxID=90732 RepID=A0A1H2DZ48_9BACT|nr:Glycosyltransferase, catalytic subunit of cellulose synthase and poly-beta-1,6-N-acetylglucosamine synthase [Desulfobacula phenolica]